MATAILHSRHFNIHNFEEVQPIPQWIKDKYQPNQYLWVLTDFSVSPAFAIFDYDIGKVLIYSDVKVIDENKTDSSYRDLNENDEPLATMIFNQMRDLKNIIMLFKNSIMVPYFSIRYGFPYFSFNDSFNNDKNKFEITPVMMCNMKETQYKTSFGDVKLNNKLNLHRLLAKSFDFVFISNRLVNKSLEFRFISERVFEAFTREYGYRPLFDRSNLVYRIKNRLSELGFKYAIQQEELDTQVWYLRLFEKVIVEYYKNHDDFYNIIHNYIESDTDVEDWFDKEEFY